MTDPVTAPIIPGAAPPVIDPPVGDPPVGDPPVVDPPVGDPPVGDPPDGGTVLTDDKGPQGAPESYADFVVPQGMEVDTVLLEQATPIFKELGLSQIQSQRLVDMYATQQQASSQANSDSYNQTVKDWVTEAKADNEIGGETFDANVGLAKRAIDSFGTPKLVQVLDQTGLGSHPEFIRLFTRIGKLIKEDDPGGGHGPTGDDLTGAEILYPNEKKTA